MHTVILEPTKENIGLAGGIIKSGGQVAFPTETVYGLGANALNATAVSMIYKMKGRPSDNPMIVHIADIADIEKLAVNVPERAYMLAEAFWPGPLTMVLRRRECVPDVTTGGLNTVGIRMPDSCAALELIKQSGCPIAAPSANISGKPSPTSAQHVYQDLNGKIPFIIDDGICRVGIESTVLDMTSDPPVILRPGAIGRSDIRKIIGIEPEYHRSLSDVGKIIEKSRIGRGEYFSKSSDSPAGTNIAVGAVKSPGMKYRHYAPKAPVTVLMGENSAVLNELSAIENSAAKENRNVGIVNFDLADSKQAAHDLFSCLREMDARGVTAIYIGLTNGSQLDDGTVFAYVERLMRSANYNAVFV